MARHRARRNPTATRSVSSTETALDPDETARQKLVTYFKTYLNRPADCPVKLEEESLAKERQRRETMLLMTISKDEGGCEVIKGLEEWLERIEDEMQTVDVATEDINEQLNRNQDYSALAQHMDQLFGQLLTTYE